jgi:hypothetical protein
MNASPIIRNFPVEVRQLSGDGVGWGFKKARKKLAKKAKALKKNKLFYAGLTAVFPGAAPALAVASQVSGDGVGKGFKKKLKKATKTVAKATKKVAKNKMVQRAALVATGATAAVVVMKNAPAIKNKFKSIKKSVMSKFASAPAASAATEEAATDEPVETVSQETPVQNFSVKASAPQTVQDIVETQEESTSQSNYSDIVKPASFSTVQNTPAASASNEESDSATETSTATKKGVPMIFILGAIALGAMFLIKK